jgi:hypothetical protein
MVNKKVFMTRLVALVFWMFKADKKQDTPYFSTCLIITLVIVVNLISIAAVCNFSYNVFYIRFVESIKINDWINTIIQGSIIWMIFFFIFPKKKLELYVFTNSQLIKTRKRLIALIIVSIIVMTLLLIKKGIDSGIIKLFS